MGAGWIEGGGTVRTIYPASKYLVSVCGKASEERAGRGLHLQDNCKVDRAGADTLFVTQ